MHVQLSILSLRGIGYNAFVAEVMLLPTFCCYRCVFHVFWLWTCPSCIISSWCWDLHRHYRSLPHNRYIVIYISWYAWLFRIPPEPYRSHRDKKNIWSWMVINVFMYILLQWTNIILVYRFKLLFSIINIIFLLSIIVSIPIITILCAWAHTVDSVNIHACFFFGTLLYTHVHILYDKLEI